MNHFLKLIAAAKFLILLLSGETSVFAYPFQVTVAGSGNVFVSDNSDNRTAKFDTNGVFCTVSGNGSGTPYPAISTAKFLENLAGMKRNQTRCL